MKFLTKNDLYISITAESLDEITECKDYILDEAEERALTTITEYLAGRYDMNYELRPYSTSGAYLDHERVLINDSVKVYDSTSGTFLKDDRNSSLKTIALDIIKYELYQSVSPKQISPVVVDRYDRAIDKLININKGMLTMALKAIQTDDENSYQPFRYGNSEWVNKNKW